MPEAVWALLERAVWPLLIGIVLFAYRRPLRLLLASLERRLSHGASLRLGPVEVGAIHVTPGRDISEHHSAMGVFRDPDGTREAERKRYYAEVRGIMLVHKLFRSREPGQLYDALLYVIPHASASLAAVARVEYFFGHMWGHRVFPSTDRSRGFPVVTSAYGPFLCSAKVHFTDGTIATLFRYIDFEMGANAPLAPADAHQRAS
jgi:hypothetical protein